MIFFESFFYLFLKDNYKLTLPCSDLKFIYLHLSFSN